MLSRIALKSNVSLPSLSIVARQCSSVVAKNEERDLINFPRRKREMFADKVRLGFIPDDWFKYFYPKTGVTGPYVFGGSLITFLVSKEILIYDHEFIVGIVLFPMIYFAHRKWGKDVSDFLDEGIKEDDKEINYLRDGSIEKIQTSIDEAKNFIDLAENQSVLFDAKKENIGLQLEAAYRERMFHAYTNIKNRLDYQLEIDGIKSRVEQKHMVDWIVGNVKKSITAAQEAATMKQCLSDLKALAAKA